MSMVSNLVQGQLMITPRSFVYKGLYACDCFKIFNLVNLFIGAGGVLGETLKANGNYKSQRHCTLTIDIYALFGLKLVMAG